MGSGLIILVEKACVIILAGYIVSRAPFMRPYVEEKPVPLPYNFLLGFIFGLFSIYGALSRIRLVGAVVIAGLVGGPIPGLIAGLMGGGHRLLIGLLDWQTYGFTAIPCAISTPLIGGPPGGYAAGMG